MAKWPYGTPAWRAARRTVLHRDQYTCRVNLPGCTTHATSVDHVTPLARGGHPFDLGNLRAACNHCNVVRSNDERAGKTNQPSRQW